MKRLTCFVALTGAFLFLNCLRAADAIVEEGAEEAGVTKTLPKIVSQPPVSLPPSLAKAGVNGKVMVNFTVREDGSVRDAVVTKSAQRQLNPYAIKAVGAWRFEPGTRNGQPASFRMRTEVEFSASGQTVPTSSLIPPPKIPTATAAPAPVLANDTGMPYDVAPVARHKPTPVYPYEMVMSGQSGSADASFVVDYAGRALFATAAGTSNHALAKVAVAMVEASEYSPGKKGAQRVMSPSSEHFQFDGERTLDPEARRILAELHKATPAIFSSAELDERPKVVQQVAPAYPRALKDDGLTGQAEIEFIISRNGDVLFPRIVSATHEDFGWAATVAVAQWHYQPPHKGGKNVEVRMSVPILFTAQRLAEAE